MITIDLGNSSTSYGVFSGRSLVKTGYSADNNIPLLISKLRSYLSYTPNIKVIISSVVPLLTSKLLKSMTQYMAKRSIYVVERDVKPKIAMKYDRKRLGSDRLVNVYGALKRYKPPLLIIDYGTAITFDYISKRGIFEGGLIVPGIEISKEALETHTALLPRIKKIKVGKDLVGKETKSAMISGLLNGFGALSDGLIERFKKRYGGKLTVIATGGFARQISLYAHGIERVDPLHTIRSLALMYQNEIEEG
ncbi:MAG: type III pantothenate kinase [Candidatus Omnitrophica bacterium]|nr:type III pantothenate kinase [Candidatus Omnitrophota bacterium]